RALRRMVPDGRPLPRDRRSSRQGARGEAPRGGGVNELPLTISEASFQSTVIDYARRCRWKVSHQRPSQVRPGRWATATTGDVGMLDLVLARDGVVLIVE